MSSLFVYSGGSNISAVFFLIVVGGVFSLFGIGLHIPPEKQCTPHHTHRQHGT